MWEDSYQAVPVETRTVMQEQTNGPIAETDRPE